MANQKDHRDNFRARVRQALALRAGYRCSFEGCDRPTIGPSDESSMAVAGTGVAAHIHAAASGGKRYLVSMTKEERADVENGIWLCATHARLVDEDDVTYTADRLRAMKRQHEQMMARLVAAAEPAQNGSELVALGPNVVATGRVSGASAGHWTLTLEHFVTGDLAALTAYASDFANLPRANRYVLANELGDGRVLAAAPVWRTTETGLVVEADVEARFPRIRAEELGTDLMLGPDGDLTPEMAMVSGVDALPQKVQLGLWHQKGDAFWDPEFGTRISEYYVLFGATPWFAQLVKMEAVRMAAIPFFDSFHNNEYTPFQCVDRVLDVLLRSDAPVDRHLPVRVRLEVVGLGEWTRDLTLFIPDYPAPPHPVSPSTSGLAAP
jgi:hypothetical protein